MKQKEPGELAKVIIECEKAEYPELNRDLRKARDMLKSFGGGLGGTKTPDFLIEKLKSARGKKDRDLIKKTINECVSAGISELDNEIQLSRETLDTMEGGTGGRNHRDILHDMLLMATKRKSPPELKKAIEECEEAEYPELNEELRKARDVLENLSGSSGGTKTATTLLNRLIKAMEMRDKDALEKIINECIASGFPQLDADIQQARNILDILEFGSGETIPSQTLRRQLEKAMEEKNKDKLEKAIQECENAVYPELSLPLSDARDILEMLIGSRGGLKTPETLLDKLKKAVWRKDRKKIEKRINECVAAGFPELDYEIQKARKVLEVLGESYEGTKLSNALRDKLKSAMKRKDKAALENAIMECEVAAYPELSFYLRRAREVLESLSGGSGAIKSTEVLREQLITATKEKDRGKLIAAIEECEDAEFLELSTYLRKAREALEMMGGGAGGYKTADTLREKLENARTLKDRSILEQVINECISSGFPGLDADIQTARDLLQTLEFQDEDIEEGMKSPEILRGKLKDALSKGNKSTIENVIIECVAHGMPELDSDIHKAREELDKIRDISRGPSLPTPDALREELKKATRQKDKRSLENIIDVCETIGYAELGPDLCRARNTLQQIGGSRGGSMSPDILKIKLKDAMEEKNKKNLDRIINECTAAGFPELENDLQKARRLSNILEGGTGDLKSPNELRDQLSMAIRKKDADVINKAIMECEAVKYPELDADIRKARVALKNLGCSRGGSKSPKVLREMLSSVMQHGNKDQLESAVNECVSAGLQELDADVQKARELLNELREKPQTGNKTPDSLRTNLRKAMREGDKGKLDGVINECVAAGMPELESDIKRAKNVLEDMIQNSTGSKSPDFLYNQLKCAITQKNKANLEKAIHDAEAAGYPELAYDLQKARETLETLGGGRGGIKTAESVREELNSAMKEADEPALERAIKDATAAGFPELAFDVQKARNKLDRLRGGRGATKSAESLKEMLQNAIATKSKAALEQAIKECEVAAYPELSYNLREARNALENIGGGRGGSKSPDILRNKLKSATSQKDSNAIEKAINECVAAGQPELAEDIQQARDILSSIGGGYRAPKSPSVLRDQLDHAVKQKNILGLERAITEAEAAKSPELSKNIQQAKDLLNSLGGGSRARSLSPEQVETLIDQIHTSIIHKDKPKLEKAITEAEPYRHPDLEPQIQKARPLLDALNIKDKLENAFLTDNQEDIRRCVIEIEQKNLTDYLSIEVNEARTRIRSYAAPDPTAFLTRDDVSIDSRTNSRMGWYMRSSGFSHDLLISALVVLGEYERHSESQAWRNYQHFFDISNSNGSSRRVLGFDIDQIYQNLSARADEILTRNSTDEVQLLNRSGQMSYSWSRSLNEQMSAYFYNLNGTMGGGETHSVSQMSSTIRTEHQAFTGSRESSQGSDNTNVYRSSTEMLSTTSTPRSVNLAGPTPFFSKQRKY